MVDSDFFDKPDKITISELAALIGAELVNCDEEFEIFDIDTIENAAEGFLSFVANSKYIDYLEKTLASAVILSKEYQKYAPENLVLLLHNQPYLAYAKISGIFYPDIYPDLSKNYEAKISKNAIISDSAYIGRNCIIEPGAVIMDNVKIGDYSYIKSGAVLRDNVQIGKYCFIGSNSVIEYSIIGDNVIIHHGSIIGKDGFGFASDHTGHHKVQQLGRVIIGDNVEIGANTTIDRGAIGDTIIGSGVHIDNLVQIAHNVEIGDNTVIVANVGIAGSTKIGKWCVIAGQVGISGHLKIGDKVQIAGQSGVINDLPDGAKVGGSPATNIISWKRQIAHLNKITKTNRKKAK